MKISEMSEKINLTQDTLRYYERIGLIPDVTRNKSGVRDYTEKNYMWIKFVKCMRSAGLPVEVLIDYLELFKQGDSTLDTRKEILIEQKSKLIEKIQEMQTTLDYLNYKIENYNINISNFKKMKE